MIAALILALAGALAPAAEGLGRLGHEAAAASAGLAAAARGTRPAPAYDGATREVSNWRAEAVRALVPSPLAALAWLTPGETRFVTRCVRLNNYWCVKRAGWPGEIGADEEGHTAFGSAAAGADAATVLLRRYYLDLGLRSALAIVRRWAPAECRLGGVSALPGLAPGPATPLALRGIGRTLRARYLASRGIGPRRARARGIARSAPRPLVTATTAAGAAAGRVAVRRGAALRPLPPLPAPRLPTIAAGIGATPAPAAPQAAPERAAIVRAALPALAPPVVTCTADEGRQRNYATRVAAGASLGPADDLALFAPDGRPLPNIALVLAAMSGFELGTLRAGADLVAGAVARLAPRIEAAAP